MGLLPPPKSNGAPAPPQHAGNTAISVGSQIEIGPLLFTVKRINDKKKEILLKLIGVLQATPAPVPDAPKLIITDPLKDVLASKNLGLKSSPKKIIVPGVI